MDTERRTLAHFRSFFDVTLVAVVVAIAAAVYMQRKPDRLTMSPQDWGAIVSGDLWLGDVNAKTTVVEFVDYRCPACGVFEGVLSQFERDHPGQTRRIIRHYPIARNGPYSDSAALAAVCAAGQHRFPEMHTALFRNPNLIVAAAWDSLASLSGVSDQPRFAHCMRSAQAATTLAADRALAAGLGVSVLPTLIVDREWLRGIEALELRGVLIDRLR
jgi:protein-disulfide isomerase